MPNTSTKTVLFYVSGHGFGHARRCGQVIRSLRAIDPTLDVQVRSTAAAPLFAGAVPATAIQTCRVDAGAAEHSPLRIDGAGTMKKIAATLAHREAIIAEELAALRGLRPSLIVADVPFLAGDIAAAAGVPCVAMSNFTWDWIVEPFADTVPDGRALIRMVGDAYRNMAGILRLPLGGHCDTFERVIEVPLIAGRSVADRSAVLGSLGIAPDDDRPRVLFAMRGAVPSQTLARAAAEMPDARLICPVNHNDAAISEMPPEVIIARLGQGLDFSDVLGVCDVVVGKMGYGLVSDCIANGVALLWPRRTGFREDSVVERDAPAILRMRELPLADFEAGHWADGVRTILTLPKPAQSARCDGAEVCAAWIASHCNGVE